MANRDVWNIARLSTDIHLCEEVNTDDPEVPPRSWAYHLIPIGIGTPDAESLTSYFVRLAEAHCVSPRALFEKKLSKVNNGIDEEKDNRARSLVDPNAKRATHQINGSGVAAEKWVKSIEEITLQNNLKFLTFLSWRSILSNRTMCRPERAWCPSCFEDQRMSGGPIYESLRWVHRIVKVCPYHKISLETKCQHCRSSSSVLCGSSRLGICLRCKGWLGNSLNRTASVFEELTFKEPAYEVFVAEQIGELVAMAPSFVCAPKQEVPRISIIMCAERFFDGNLCAFARFFGMRKDDASSLWQGKTRFTNLELLLRVAYRAGITLLDLFTKDNALDDFIPSTSSTIANNRLSPRHNKENVLRMLSAAVEETPPPSLKEMAERLGYSSACTLRRYFPQICYQIKTNYMESARGKDKKKFSTSKIQKDEVIKAALESALKEEASPSLKYIGKSLGYTDGQALRSRFPELCKALSEKRLNLISSRRGRIEGELKQALASDPPISLDTVSEKLGYRTTATLRTAYPELCRKIRRRHNEHNKTQFIMKIDSEVRSILIESPPPTLKAALQRIGLSDGFLRKHFPNEHRLISTRYLEYRKEESERNKISDRNKIKCIVRDLIKRGVFPSMNAVLYLSKASHLKRPEVWAAIQQAREEFSSPI